MALILSFLYIVLLRWIAGPMIFVGIFLAIILCIGGTFLHCIIVIVLFSIH